MLHQHGTETCSLSQYQGKKKKRIETKEAVESRASVELIVWVLDNMVYVYLIFFSYYYYFFFFLNAMHGMLAEKMKK